jgi:hypothetical protein
VSLDSFSFSVGELYSNEEIYTQLSVGNSGGIRVSLGEDKLPRRLVVMTPNLSLRNLSVSPINSDNWLTAALYSRCIAWIHRDGDAGWARAKRVLENLHRDHPDYVFARTTLVNYLLDDGKVDEAKEMLVPVRHRKRLHATDARALFSAQAEICQHEGDLAGCQRTIDMLANILDENDATGIQWRQKIAYREQFATLKKLSLDQLLK